MMTGRRPLGDISTFQSACAYHKISDMPVGLQLSVYLPYIVDLVETKALKKRNSLGIDQTGSQSRRFNIEGFKVVEN